MLDDSNAEATFSNVSNNSAAAPIVGNVPIENKAGLVPCKPEVASDPKVIEALQAIDDVYGPDVFTAADFEELRRLRAVTPVTTQGHVLPTDKG